MTAASATRFPPNRSSATSSIRAIALVYRRGHPHCKVNKIPLACGQTRFWHSVYITAQRFGPVHLASARRRGGTEWWSVVGDELTDFVGLNLFGCLTLPVLGRILTGAIVGGGCQLLHKIIEAAGDLAAKWAAPYR